VRRSIVMARTGRISGAGASSARRQADNDTTAASASSAVVLGNFTDALDLPTTFARRAAGNTTQDNTSPTASPVEPSAEAKPSSEAQATSVKTPAQAKPEETASAPATALHERVQAGTWLGSRPADNNAMGRQILFNGISRDYFTAVSWSANGGNSTASLAASCGQRRQMPMFKGDQLRQ